MIHPADPRSAANDHAGHDLLLVAEAADRGNVLPARLIDCPDCQALHADLRALAAATPESALPTRPRDFRLSAADAARLRRPAWRRWLAGIGSSRDTVTRPLAYGLTTLGLAGLLISAGPNILSVGSGTAGAPVELAAPAEGASAGASEAPGAEEAPEALPEGGVDTTGDGSVERVGGGATSAPAAPSGPSEAGAMADPGQAPGDGDAGDGVADNGARAPGVDDLTIRDDPSGLSALLVLGGTLLIAGLGLFALRWTGRRIDG